MGFVVATSVALAPLWTTEVITTEKTPVSSPVVSVDTAARPTPAAFAWLLFLVYNGIRPQWKELSRKVLGAPSPGRLLQGDFPGDAPEACPEPVEGTGAESVFKDFPGDLGSGEGVDFKACRENHNKHGPNRYNS